MGVDHFALNLYLVFERFSSSQFLHQVPGAFLDDDDTSGTVLEGNSQFHIGVNIPVFHPAAPHDDESKKRCQ